MVFWDDFTTPLGPLGLPPIDQDEELRRLAQDEPQPPAHIYAAVEQAVTGRRNTRVYRVHSRVEHAGYDVTVAQVARVLLDRFDGREA